MLVWDRTSILAGVQAIIGFEPKLGVKDPLGLAFNIRT
jgi:hypothetical protein